MKEENANMAARYEREIPEGYEARIEGNKVIIELKESEDERIRKWLIEMVEEVRKANPTNAEHNEKCSEAIAYLEKLKDLTKEGIIKQLEEEFYACGTTPKWFHDTVQGAINHGRADALSKFNAVPSVVSDELRRQERETAISQLKHLNDVYIGEEKQKEQKPAKEDEIDYDLGREIGIDAGIGLCKSAEWSEEDNKALNRAINICKNDFGEDSETAKFLKSLPERFNLPPKQEWSEEDEETLKDIINSVNGFDATTGTFSQNLKRHKKKIKWLKSLRPQPKQEWSEEEKKELDSIIDDYEKAAKSFCGYDGKIMFLKAIRNGEYGLSKKEKEWIRQNGRLDVCYNPEKYGLCYKIKWNEEDEKHKQAIIDAIQIVMAECGDSESIEKYQEDINWFELFYNKLKKS